MRTPPAALDALFALVQQATRDVARAVQLVSKGLETGKAVVFARGAGPTLHEM